MLPCTCTCTCIYTVVRLAQLHNNEALGLNFDIHMHIPHVRHVNVGYEITVEYTDTIRKDVLSFFRKIMKHYDTEYTIVLSLFWQYSDNHPQINQCMHVECNELQLLDAFLKCTSLECLCMHICPPRSVSWALGLIQYLVIHLGILHCHLWLQILLFNIKIAWLSFCCYCCYCCYCSCWLCLWSFEWHC